jgi:hypothetical protein
VFFTALDFHIDVEKNAVDQSGRNIGILDFPFGTDNDYRTRIRRS